MTVRPVTYASNETWHQQIPQMVSVNFEFPSKIEIFHEFLRTDHNDSLTGNIY